MNFQYDTSVLQSEMSRILDKYKPENTSLPEINSEDFLESLQKYSENIFSDCRMKMNILMVTLGYADKNVSEKLYELIRNMIEECDQKLTQDEKKYLQWQAKATPDSYNFIPKSDTISKWLNGKRTPNRLSLYKISLALHLPIYLHDVAYGMDMQSKKYIASANYLFNKIYNQRYSSKQADELIFVYQLVNMISQNCNNLYLQSMKMLAEYHKKEIACKENEFIGESDTMLIVGKGIEMLPEAFVDFLVKLSPALNLQYSSVNKSIASVIEKFSDSKVTNQFLEKYYQSNKMLIQGFFNDDNMVGNSDENMANYVLISPILKDNIEFLNKRMAFCTIIQKTCLNQLPKLKKSFYRYNISNEIFEYLSCFELSDIEDIMFFIVKEIMLTEREVYNVLSADNKNIHDLMRKILIITHFFEYWSNVESETEYDAYKSEIDFVLIRYGYMPMYAKNLFDSFFMLCSQFYDPIVSYYSVINRVFSYYNEFQNAFLNATDQDLSINYRPLSSHIPIIISKGEDVTDYIDDISVQKKLLKEIK